MFILTFHEFRIYSLEIFFVSTTILLLCSNAKINQVLRYDHSYLNT